MLTTFGTKYYRITITFEYVEKTWVRYFVGTKMEMDSYAKQLAREATDYHDNMFPTHIADPYINRFSMYIQVIDMDKWIKETH